MLGFTYRRATACSTATPVLDKVKGMILSCIPNAESKLPAATEKELTWSRFDAA